MSQPVHWYNFDYQRVTRWYNSQRFFYSRHQSAPLPCWSSHSLVTDPNEELAYGCTDQVRRLHFWLSCASAPIGNSIFEVQESNSRRHLTKTAIVNLTNFLSLGEGNSISFVRFCWLSHCKPNLSPFSRGQDLGVSGAPLFWERHSTGPSTLTTSTSSHSVLTSGPSLLATAQPHLSNNIVLLPTVIQVIL